MATSWGKKTENKQIKLYLHVFLDVELFSGMFVLPIQF